MKFFWPMIQGRKGWMFFLGNMFGLSLRIFSIFAKQSSFLRMAKALSNADFWLTSWPLMTTCRRRQLCYNGSFAIASNKRSVQLVNLPYLGISTKVVFWLHRDTKVIRKRSILTRTMLISHWSEALSCRE